MKISDLNEIETLLKKENYRIALEEVEAFCEVNPSSLLGVILKFRVLRKIQEDNVSQLMYDCVNRYINACKKEKLETLSSWPVISTLHRNIMMKDTGALPQFKTFLEKRPRSMGAKPKLLVLTCVWKRHELTNAFYRYYKKIKQELADTIEITLLAVGSEGNTSRVNCQAHGFNYVEADNSPLTYKWQAGMQEASKFQFDGMVILGSDDFIEKEVFYLYKKALENNIHFYGFRDMYLYDVPSKNFGHWLGYGSASGNVAQPTRIGETIGLGRLISRELLEFLSFDIWSDISANKSLDRLMKEKIISKTGLLPVAPGDEYQSVIGHQIHKLGLVADTFESNNLVGVDVKHEINVTDFKKYNASEECYIKKDDKDLHKLDFFSEIASLHS